MAINLQPGPERDREFFQKRAVQLSILFLLLITSFAVRLYHITQLPHDFATERQYQSAHIAREYYFKSQDSISEWRRNVAEINSRRMGLLLEPRILETLTVFGYRILGGERLWIPRVLSSLFWLTGGIFLFLIARKISSPGAAIFSTLFYLFLPFSILASRSFQPDPLMVMLFIWSIFMILRYYEAPSFLNLALAAIVSAAAILVKPYSLFFIFGAYLSVGIFIHGIRKALLNMHIVGFSVMSFFPACVYYISIMLHQSGYINELSRGSFIPNLLLKPYFWKDWILLIGQVVGYIPFAVAFIALFMAKKSLSRALLSGLWLGYFIFGLFFTLHIHTHDYYHLMFIPVLALSLGHAGALGIHYMCERWKIFLPALLTCMAGAIILIAQIDAKVIAENKNNLKIIGNVLGVNHQFKNFITGNFHNEGEKGKAIGEIVAHSTNTVFMTPYFGRAIAYNGEFSGLPWPIQSSLRNRRERGMKPLAKDDLFNPGYLTIRTHGKYIKYTPDFFIITDIRELEEQIDLKEFLSENFPVIAQTEDYIIFDMRKMSG